jgi:hypothetical protein
VRANKLLTICLITQGRKEVREFLERASGFEDLDFVNFLIIDNGAPYRESSIIEAWSRNQPRTKYIKRERNSIDFNDLWPLIEEHGSEWVNFPGDDDRLIRQSYLDWRDLVIQKNNVNAIAMSANIIDSEGKATGETVGPSFSGKNSRAQQIALALHAPPFFWPTLFFKKSVLKPPFPRSRFVLDWVVSLQLILHGGVIDSHTSSLEYRRHSNQESNQVSLNRKFFEAGFQIDEFISGKSFTDSLGFLSDDEMLDLWSASVQNSPVYGDSEFANIVLFSLAKSILTSTKDLRIKHQIVSDLALTLGTLFHDQSLSEIMPSGDIYEITFGNIKVSNVELICPYLGPLVESFTGFPSSVLVSVSCKHESGDSAAIHIKCENYEILTNTQKLDRLVQEINDELVRRGEIGFKISPRERKLLLFFRKIKPLLPRQLIMKMRKSL